MSNWAIGEPWQSGAPASEHARRLAEDRANDLGAVLIAHLLEVGDMSLRDVRDYLATHEPNPAMTSRAFVKLLSRDAIRLDHRRVVTVGGEG